jgi:ribosome biogenesis GTPase
MVSSGLKGLGFDEWFEERLDASRLGACEPARVVAVDRERYLIQNVKGTVPAEVTGKLLYGAQSPLDIPTVGDWVYAQYLDGDTFAVVHDLLPRRTVLRRKASGKKVELQLIGANIDRACITQSLEADFNLRRMERYLAMVHEEGIRPVILLSKRDRVAPEEAEEKARAVEELAGEAEVPVVPFSNLDDTGPLPVEAVLTPGETFCLVGSSGVGKTTLLNRLLGEERFDTREVRADGRGRHATTRRQLIRLPGGAMIIDTPGMRELGNLDIDAGIEQAFDEIAELAFSCRYGDCTHTHEEGCAIVEAVGQGRISRERYENYLKLRNESLHHDRSYVERRKRDRAFGKYIKTAKKTMPKR